MENRNSNKLESKSNRVDEFLKEWKRRKLEDEKEFLQEINNPDHKKKMEIIRGKTVKNGIASA